MQVKSALAGFFSIGFLAVYIALLHAYSSLSSLSLFGASIHSWHISIQIFLISYIISRGLIPRVIKGLESFASTTDTALDNRVFSLLRRHLINPTGIDRLASVLFLLRIAVFPMHTEDVDQSFLEGLSNIAFVVCGVTFLKIIWGIIVIFLDYLALESSVATSGHVDTGQYKNMVRFSTPIFYALGSIWIADNIGINIGAITAGLGISGIAIALSTQNLLSDIFAAFVIMFDRSFKVGQFIQVQGADKGGTVEAIGMRSVKVRATTGEEMTFPNRDICFARFSVFHPIAQRRKFSKLCISHEVDAQKVQIVGTLMKEALTVVPKAKLISNMLVDLGPRCFEFEFIWSLEFSTLDEFREACTKVNLALLKLLEENQIKMATLPFDK